jgi:hypothetical protein
MGQTGVPGIQSGDSLISVAPSGSEVNRMIGVSNLQGAIWAAPIS